MVRKEMILRVLLMLLLAAPAWADTVVVADTSLATGGLIRVVVMGEELPQEILTLIAAAGDSPAIVDTAAPFLIASRNGKKVFLRRNPHCASPVRPDTVLVLLEEDAARGVFMVEAGLADIAPVGEEDIARLSAENSLSGRLEVSPELEYLAFLPVPPARKRAELLRRAVNRPLIHKVLFNQRGRIEGPPYLAATFEERKGWGDTPIFIAVTKGVRARYGRILDRIAFDLEKSGFSVEFIESGSDRETGLRIAVFPEADLPLDALPLFAMPRVWFVSNEIEGFSSAGSTIPSLPSAGRRGSKPVDVEPSLPEPEP